MVKAVEKGGNPFKIVSIVLGVLVVAAVVVIGILASQNSNTKAELTEVEQQLSGLQSELSGVRSTLSSTQSKLTAAETKSTTLQADLTAATARIETMSKDVSSKQSTIDAQAAQIKKMMYPHNFSTVDELTGWLQKNNPVTWDPLALTAVQRVQMTFALQIKAARDGYLMPAVLPMFGNLDWMTNRTVVGDIIYEVRAWDSFAQIGGRVTPAVPSYPIPPESGK